VQTLNADSEAVNIDEPPPSDAGAEQQLLDAVRRQCEYYFSQQNLQSDAYLTSQMDANMAVPIAVVMKFSKMKALTEDEAVLRKALEVSSLTVVDDRIKANLKAVGRSTIILREIPADATEDEVKEIFAFDGCKPIASMRSDIGDTWFVVMDSEEDAKDTLIDLKLKKRTFRGQPVKGRLKSEAVVRSFYPVPGAPAGLAAGPAGSMYAGTAGIPVPLALPMQFPPVAGFVPAGGMPVDMRFVGYGPLGPMVPSALPIAPNMSSDGVLGLVTPPLADGGESPRPLAAQNASGGNKGERRGTNANGAHQGAGGRGAGANNARGDGGSISNNNSSAQTRNSNSKSGGTSSGPAAGRITSSGGSKEGSNTGSSSGTGARTGGKSKEGKSGSLAAASGEAAAAFSAPQPIVDISAMNFPPLAGLSSSSCDKEREDAGSAFTTVHAHAPMPSPAYAGAVLRHVATATASASDARSVPSSTSSSSSLAAAPQKTNAAAASASDAAHLQRAVDGTEAGGTDSGETDDSPATTDLNGDKQQLSVAIPVKPAPASSASSWAAMVAANAAAAEAAQLSATLASPPKVAPSPTRKETTSSSPGSGSKPAAVAYGSSSSGSSSSSSARRSIPQRDGDRQYSQQHQQPYRRSSDGYGERPRYGDSERPRYGEGRGTSGGRTSGGLYGSRRRTDDGLESTSTDAADDVDRGGSSSSSSSSSTSNGSGRRGAADGDRHEDGEAAPGASVKPAPSGWGGKPTFANVSTAIFPLSLSYSSLVATMRCALMMNIDTVTAIRRNDDSS
jgi:hypothetical protein